MSRHLVVLIAATLVTGCGEASAPTFAVKAGSAAPVTAVAAPDPWASSAVGPEVAFLAECRGYLARGTTLAETLRALEPTLATLETYNEVLRNFDGATGMIEVTRAVHPDAAMRVAAYTCNVEASKAAFDLTHDRAIYDRLVTLDLADADANTRRFHAALLRDFRRAGVALDERARARLRAIDQEIITLGTETAAQIAADDRVVEVKDAKRLAGLPPAWIADHPPDANGVIALTDHDSSAILEFAEDDALRRQVFVLASSRGKDNAARFLRVFTLRAEAAKLLGFKTWADFQSDDKMLRGGAAIAGFLERIATIAKPRAKAEAAELLAELRKTAPRATVVTAWQQAFVRAKLTKARFGFDAAEVRKYFVYDNVLAGLLAITSQIYDLEYTRVTDATRWHEDVVVFDVARKGTPLGRIFLDMHPRPDKYGRAVQISLKRGVVGKQLPEGVLSCNVPNPKTSNGPALLEHDEVVTMFHEFGHLLHHILAGRQRWIRQSGIATEYDFGEVPSQMFERWAWDPATLARFAKHHETGAVIPAELVATLRAPATFGLGTEVSSQVFFAALSLQFHRIDPGRLDALALVKQLHTSYMPFPYVEGTTFYTSMDRLVDTSSEYYTYLWSDVIAHDLLTMFDHGGLLSTATTFSYRDTILVPGGTKDAADLVKDFLGRDYDFAAYEKHLN